MVCAHGTARGSVIGAAARGVTRGRCATPGRWRAGASLAVLALAAGLSGCSNDFARLEGGLTTASLGLETSNQNSIIRKNATATRSGPLPDALPEQPFPDDVVTHSLPGAISAGAIAGAGKGTVQRTSLPPVAAKQGGEARSYAMALPERGNALVPSQPKPRETRDVETRDVKTTRATANGIPATRSASAATSNTATARNATFEAPTPKRIVEVPVVPPMPTQPQRLRTVEPQVAQPRPAPATAAERATTGSFVAAGTVPRPRPRPARTAMVERAVPTSRPGVPEARGMGTGGRKDGTAVNYEVRSGDTVFAISRRFGVPPQAIVSANALTGSAIRVGQVLRIPNAGSRANVEVPRTTASTQHRTTPSPKRASPPATSNREAVASERSVPDQAAPTTRSTARRGDLVTGGVQPTRPSGAKRIAFRWPVTGRILSRFGDRPDGSINDGIDIAVPEGTPVRVAADGLVLYAGAELEDFGRLILVRHADGWVSAYAHSSSNLVNRGDRVTKGQVIARSGRSGRVSVPQLHFELRRNSRPVDPTRFLPRG